MDQLVPCLSPGFQANLEPSCYGVHILSDWKQQYEIVQKKIKYITVRIFPRNSRQKCQTQKPQLESWRFFFKFLKLDLVFLANLVLSSISSQPSNVIFLMNIYIYLMSLTYLCDLRFTDLTYVTFSPLYLNIRLDYFSHLIVCLIQVDNK